MGMQWRMMGEWRKELRKSFVDCLCLGLSGRASGIRHTVWQHIKMSPYAPPSRVPCALQPKAEKGCHAHCWAMRGPLRVSWFAAQWSVWLVHTFVNFMRQRQSHCLQVRQLNDLLSKGYSTCAFLSTNQAHAMASDSSNNPNGNLVLNSTSDTTILLMQNSDRFGWQGRNACF